MDIKHSTYDLIFQTRYSSPSWTFAAWLRQSRSAVRIATPSALPRSSVISEQAGINHSSESRRPRLHGNCGTPPQVERTGARQAAETLRPKQSRTSPAQPLRQPNPHEWSGLAAWRAKGRDLRLRWGPAPDAASPLELPAAEAPTLEYAMCLVAASAASASQPAEEEADRVLPPPAFGLRTPCSLVEAGWLVLRTADPAAKAALTHAAWGAYLEGRLPLRPVEELETMAATAMAAAGGTAVPAEPRGTMMSQNHLALRKLANLQEQMPQQHQQQEEGRRGGGGEGKKGQQWPQQCLASGPEGPTPLWPKLPLLLPDRPARPERPRLVKPKDVPGHESSPLGLNGCMLHNLAHIELNAIDLAWDSVVRFSVLGLPDQFYEDFARVADDESRHLGWCLQRLAELGYRYGDMDAHDLLWQGCQASALDVGARLAVVPMSQEARGLDAGSRLVSRLVGFGDARSAAVVGLIAVEERAHVAVGVTWFTRLCGALGIKPERLYRQWLLNLNPDLLKGPFNHSERSKVGLPREWYDPAAWTDEDSEAERERGDGLSPSTASVSKSAAASHSTSETISSTSHLTGAEGRRQVRWPSRGSPYPRLTGPQPRLSSAQLVLLAERLAVFGGLEAAATVTGDPDPRS